MRELHVNEDATEIAIISRFDLLFQSLRDYIGDISEFHILCRIVALNEIVDMSKGKITRTLDSASSCSSQTLQRHLLLLHVATTNCLRAGQSRILTSAMRSFLI
jgi:hypothetical protein